jgi:hypothetical protein
MSWNNKEEIEATCTVQQWKLVLCWKVICREDYMLLAHPRASYIQKVRKQDVDAELAGVGLSCLGSRDSLRKWLGMYAQTNPTEFVHIELMREAERESWRWRWRCQWRVNGMILSVGERSSLDRTYSFSLSLDRKGGACFTFQLMHYSHFKTHSL